MSRKFNPRPGPTLVSRLEEDIARSKRRRLKNKARAATHKLVRRRKRHGRH